VSIKEAAGTVAFMVDEMIHVLMRLKDFYHVISGIVVT
jgi:hypothetical protein